MKKILNNILSRFFSRKQCEETQVAEEPVTVPVNELETFEKPKDSEEPVEQELLLTEYDCQTSLLDNSEYMSLAQQCCDMLKELDVMYKQIPNDQVKKFVLQQKTRIREALILSGATLIDEETEFNLLRHQSVNGGIVKNGTPITETVEPGVEIEGRVMIKAKSKI